jgi:hypothetical protein
MMTLALIVVVVASAVRLGRVRVFWSWPLRNGEDWFLAQRVGPGFYAGEGAPLLRRYRTCLFLPLALDAPLIVALAATRRFALLMCEQWMALILTLVVYNLILAHFSARATVSVVTPEERPATTVQLSMAPRRLRDHSHRFIELAIAACLLISFFMLGRLQGTAAGPNGDWHAARAVRAGLVTAVWIVYVQVGLLLLKMVFVRWRMPLPMRRTEDFRRWRSAWLRSQLNFVDAVRVSFGLLLPSTMVWLTFKEAWRQVAVVLGSLWALAILALVLFLNREGRRLLAVEREIKPVELVKEFPRPPIAEGRFLAGGLLYWSRDNPGVLVRSPQGIALNLGHTSTYAWTGYFVGLALLMTWMVH